MLNISDAIRSYWTFGLNNITTNTAENLTNWIERGEKFQISANVSKEKFELVTINRRDFLLPISQDCNRFGVAAFESAIMAEKTEGLPKSLSWILVKMYYSAFYSGHLLLRLIGLSLTQFDRITLNKVEDIADIFGYLNGVRIEKGFYACDYSDRTNKIVFEKCIKTGEDGSHGIMWNKLSEKFRFISLDILKNKASVDYQQISIKISEFVDNLNFMGNNNGCWLSKIRNDINYKHFYGTWFPYRNYKSYYPELRNHLSEWKRNPLEIELKNLAGKELFRFSNTCQFLTSVVREVCMDMNMRCSFGSSFHKNGSIALLTHQKIIR